MKVLAFVDYHNQEQYLPALRQKAEEADIIICAGDPSWFERDLEQTLALFNDWGKKVFMIHGNHEQEHHLKILCKQFENIDFCHGETRSINGKTIAFWGGGGFVRIDMKLLEQRKHWSGVDVFVTHPPPSNTKVDFIGRHVGNDTIRKVIEELQPQFCICGHIHECAGMQDRIGTTVVLNPGPEGRIIVL